MWWSNPASRDTRLSSSWPHPVSATMVGRGPGLRARMLADPGLGDPTLLADRYLAAAERMTGRPGVREQRIFLAPRLCAALLQTGDRDGALRLLDDTIARCREVRDPDAGHEWQQTLTLVRRCLAGDAAVDAGRLRDDPRLEPLLPFLH